MDYAAAVDVLRVTVNEGGSTGSAGFGTHLAPSMTIGTGFVGRSSLGENLEPKHLVNWTRIAYSTDAERGAAVVRRDRPVGSAGRSGAAVPGGQQPGATARSTEPRSHRAPSGSTAELREELRRLIIEELTTIIRG